MRHAARVDTNQAEIVDALRRAGCSVAVTSSLGHGFPDLVVGRHDKNYLIEIKHGAGKLTDDEREFHEIWRGSVTVVRSVDQALAAVGAV